MKKYCILFLLLLTMGGFSSCVIGDAEPYEPTEAPFLAFRAVRQICLDHPAYLVKEFLFADEYLFADETARNEMAQHVFVHHRVAAMDGCVHMQNNRTYEKKIQYTPQQGSSLREVGASWLRTSDRDGSPKHVLMRCIEEDTWEVFFREEEYLAPYCTLKIKAVPTDVKLSGAQDLWSQQYEVLEVSGSFFNSGQLSFWYNNGGFFDNQSVSMRCETLDAFGMYFDGQMTQLFDGELAIAYRAQWEPDVEFTATFGTWAQKNVCIRWLNHEKIWRQ